MSGIVIPPGTEDCGCCDGIAPSTPQGLFNRSGLSAIDYRIGEYAQFKSSLTVGLLSSAHPALARLLTRDSDDFTIALLDAFSCAADVLTFYQERVANESYLRTATERVSLQEMAKLIGYQLRPGVAAETWLAFALEPPRLPPAGLAPEPGAFVTGIPAALTLATGLKVQSVPGPDEKPQTFETVEALDARPEWNAIRATPTEQRQPARGDTFTWLQGVANNLKAGDALVFAGSEFFNAPATNNNWDFRLIDAVTLDAAGNRTLVSWKRGLGSLLPRSDPSRQPQVHVLRKRAAVFGHNAPQWRSLNESFRKDYVAHSGGAFDAADWPAFTPSPNGASDSAGYVDLDAVYAEVANGSLVAVAKGEFNRPDEAFPRGTYVELYTVTSSAEVSRADFALSGKLTRLGLAGQNLLSQFFTQGLVRLISVYAQSEALAIVPYPLTQAVSGDRVPVAVPTTGLDAGRKLIVKGTRADNGAAVTHQATLVAVQAAAGGSVLVITPPLPNALARASVVVHANVALATHGETAAQILGAGDASKRFQRFELKRTPLTYRAAANETGAASELSIRVGDVQWSEKPTLFGAAPSERAYTVTTDEAGKTWAVFGDGERGARLPSGVNNVRASYRQGLGQQGNVGPEQLSQLVTRPLGLKSVANPLAASGGTGAEPADQARRSMPLGTRTLGRAVSLLDYEDFALAFTGVAKAQAQVLQLAAGPTVAITIAGQDGALLAPTNPVFVNLLAALKAGGDPHVNVALLSYKPIAFRLGLKFKRDPAYAAEALRAAIDAALRAHFAFDARALAQPVLQSDVIATVHSVPGVVAVDLDALYLGSFASLQVRLLASRMRVSAGVALPAELLTLASGPFDRLEEFT